MIDTGAIRNKVLDLALQGMLTERLDIDDIIPDIKSDDNSISDEEKEFVIPDSWRWIRLGWIMDIDRGGSPRPIKAFLTTEENGINWIKIGDVAKNGKYILSTKEKIKPEGEKKSRRVYPGDFLLTNSMSFGRPYITQIEGCVHDGWLILRNREELFNLDFLYHLLSSNYVYRQFCEKASGATVDNLNKDKVSTAVIPLPPLAEQQRIVERVESIFSLLDEIDEAQAEYKNNETILRSRLIDLGVTGKLTKRLDSDIPFENELSRLSINDKLPLGNELCEIPDNWKWVCLGNLGQDYKQSFADGPFGSNLKREHYTDKKEVRIIQLSNVGENGWKDDNEKYTTFEHLKTIARSEIHSGDIVIAKMMPAGRAIIVPEKNCKFVLSSDNIKFEPNSILNTKYLIYAINSSLFRSQIDTHGIGRERTSLSKLKEYSIPVPPLREQERIVNTIEELLELCS